MMTFVEYYCSVPSTHFFWHRHREIRERVVRRDDHVLLPIEDLPLDETYTTRYLQVCLDLFFPLVNELGGIEDNEGRETSASDEVEGNHGFSDAARELQ